MAGDLDYTTGTISVTAGASVIVGVGTSWSLVAEKYDVLVPTGVGHVAVVKTVTDDTHIVPFGGWQGATLAGVTYTLIKNSVNRFVNADAMQVVIDSWEMLQQTGIIYAVVGVGVLPDVSIGTNGQYAINLDENPWKFYKKVAGVWVLQSLLLTSATVRERLTANRTYYVRTDGNDSSSGIADSAGGAFLTIQKAIDTAVALDLSTFSITIQVRTGTFTGNVTFKSYVGVGPIILVGDVATPTNVLISTVGNCITADGVLGAYQIRGFKLQSTTTGALIECSNSSVIAINGNMNYGAAAGGSAQLRALFGGKIRITANYTISGGASAHFLLDTQALISNTPITVTLTGTPAFTFTFAFANNYSAILAGGITFSGAATGVRYNASSSIISSGGGGPNYFPGNSAGSVSFGGIYI